MRVITRRIAKRRTTMPTSRSKTDAPAKPRRTTKSAEHRTARSQAALPQAALPERGLTEDAIAFRAYEIFLQRGGEHGRALDDWVAAERELLRPELSQTG